MANKGGFVVDEQPGDFADEVKINFHDLNFYEEIGRGAYGTVQRAVWEDREVAVKIIDIGCGVREYQDEVQQLSNVTHDNIIQLFGTSMYKQKVYIIMEYADCGSLYNLLHPSEEEGMVWYNAGHVVRWSLQCAKAVEYLHSLQPKVIHRDLKPPNMLLTQYGKVIKICDFGTATQIKTEMTSNKGSAAWMAPEVFEGKHYSEKCDVYSFGIVLWEMLSRKKPFDEIGPPAFRILWAVYNGTRPPPLKNIPQSLMNLMENCWAKEQIKRPSFSDIVKYLSILDGLAQGADEPLFVDAPADEYESSYYDNQYNPLPNDREVNTIFDWQSAVPQHEGFQLDTPPYLRASTTTMIPDEQKKYQAYTSPNHYGNNNQMSPRSFQSPNPPYFNKYPSVSPDCSDTLGTYQGHMVNVNWGLVPEHLRPIKPITNVPVSIKLYENYIEALKKYIDLQVKIKDLKVQKENLDGQIVEVNKNQKQNAFYLERYVKLTNDKAELLEHHKTIKTILEEERRRRSHTP